MTTRNYNTTMKQRVTKVDESIIDTDADDAAYSSIAQKRK